MQEPEK